VMSIMQKQLLSNTSPTILFMSKKGPKNYIHS
jgi:hypothetical protein